VEPNDGALQFCGQPSDGDHVLLKVANLLALPFHATTLAGSATSVSPPDELYGRIVQAI